MRIHDDLREGGGTGAEPPRPDDVPIRPAPQSAELALVGQAHELAAGLAERMASLERDLTSEREEVRETVTRAERLQRNWRLGLIGLGSLALVVVLLGSWQTRNVNWRLDEAASRVAVAERLAQTASDAANRQMAATRADAERQIADAREEAARAEVVSTVLAAPDLVRFGLTGVPPEDRAYAQVLWSRSRGLVLSASGLSAAPAGMTYQVWLVTSASPAGDGTNPTPARVGPLVPDATGSATLATSTLTRPPHPVTGVVVTLESGEPAAPSGSTVLARAQQ
jgi:hypothetical protein